MTENEKQPLDEFTFSGEITPEVVEASNIREFEGTPKELAKYLGQKETLLQNSRAVEIPYYDHDGVFLYSRYRFYPPLKGDMKYLSPKGKAPVPYILSKTWEISSKSKVPIWITEGEKKTLFLLSKGVEAIGLQGVWMFCEEKGEHRRLHPNLKSFIRAGRRVVIAFDADSDENPEVRKALLKLAFILYLEGARVEVATWPAEQGKGIDDYLYNQLREIDQVQVIPLKKYIEPYMVEDATRMAWRVTYGGNDLEREKLINLVSRPIDSTKSTLKKSLRKMDSKRLQLDKAEEKGISYEWKEGEIFHDHGRTWILKFIGKGDERELRPFEVANFTAQIIHKITTEINHGVEVLWEIELTRYTGEKASLEIRGAEKVTHPKWREKLGGVGNYLYNLSSITDHNLYLEWLFNRKTFKPVEKINYLGRVKPDLYAFNNDVAIEASGKVTTLKNILLPEGRMNYNYRADCKIADLATLWLELYELNVTWKSLGFSVASLFSEEIFQEFGFFPILFLYGKKGTGKSVLAEFITALFGAHRELTPFNFSSTPKSIFRSAAKYKGIPITLNEYQNGKKNNNLLISFYDREGYSRAKFDNSLDIQKPELHSTLMVLSTKGITGNEADAVTSRVVEVEMKIEADPEVNERKKELVRTLWARRDGFCELIRFCMQRINPAELVENIRQKILDQVSTKAESRVVYNHSIFAGAFETFWKTFSGQERATVDITREMLMLQQEIESKNPGKIFLDILLYLREMGKLSKDICYFSTFMDEASIVFNLPMVLPEVQATAMRAGVEIADMRTLGIHFRDMDGHQKHLVYSGTGKRLRFWVIPIYDEQFDGTEEFIEDAKEQQEVSEYEEKRTDLF